MLRTYTMRLAWAAFLVSMAGCGLTTKDDCEKAGDRWVCVDEAPGPQPAAGACVCEEDDGDDADIGPEPLPW